MKALIALGSNLGDRQAHLAAGLAALRTLGGVVPSPLVMETPDESGRGPAYLNTVAVLVTEETDPRRLLESLLRLELAQGRDRTAGRNAPRTLDLDLITTDGPPGRWTCLTPGPSAAPSSSNPGAPSPIPAPAAASFLMEGRFNRR